MKEFLVFYYIVLAIALSITIPLCYYCNQIDICGKKINTKN